MSGVVGQAVGIVMERYGMDETRAFGFLTRLSNQTNIKVREIAARIVSQTNDKNRQTSK